MCPGSSYRIHTVRAVGPDDTVSETTHFVASEDAALDAMAEADGFPSYRAWQAAHPDWFVGVRVKDDPPPLTED